MMARSSTHSNRKPDTLMQDRISARSTKPSCTARPDHTCGSTAVSLKPSTCLPLNPQYHHGRGHLGSAAQCCMARPRGTRWTFKIDERESCINVSGLEVEHPAPGHHGYPRASKACYRKDLEGPNWHPVSWLRRADRSSISSFHLADLGGEAVDVELLSLRSDV
jgi:hypothetical protein